MVLVIHIVIAVVSVGYVTYLYFAPTDNKFYVTYGLVGLTIASGTALVISSGANILKSCLMGLFYIGAVSVAIVAARQKTTNQYPPHEK